jgi:hypothetical protein
VTAVARPVFLPQRWARRSGEIFLVRAAALSNFKFSFRRFSTPTASQTHPTLRKDSDESGAVKSETQLRSDLLEQGQSSVVISRMHSKEGWATRQVAVN